MHPVSRASRYSREPQVHAQPRNRLQVPGLQSLQNPDIRQPHRSPTDLHTSKTMEDDAPITAVASWEWITDERVAQWDVTGRDEVITGGAEMEAGSLRLTGAVREIIESGVIHTRLSAQAAATTLSALGSSKVRELILDIAWLLDTDELPDSNIEARERLLSLLRACAETGIWASTPTLPHEYLSVPLLSKLGWLNTPAPIFEKKVVRANTSALYKQQKYNLLREENEGFSKLLTILLDSSKDKRDAGSGSAKEKMNEVKAVIGYFNLDPNRVLDVIVDVGVEACADRYQYFLDLLRESPWWPSSSRRDSPLLWEEKSAEEKKAFLAELAADPGVLARDALHSHDGNSLAAQLLGFKFRYYQPSTISPQPEPTPESLYMFTALLIKEGFVSLTALWPYLSTTDEELQKEEGKWKAEMGDKALAAKGNALAMAGGLGEEPAGGSAPTRTTKDGDDVEMEDEQVGSAEEVVPMAEPPQQKIALLKALLAVGALSQAMYVLGRFPFLTATHPEIADGVMRLVDWMIEPLYSPLSVKSQLGFDVTAGEADEREVKRVFESTPGRGTPRQKLVFFYEEWRRGVFQIETGEEFLSVVIPLLRVVGIRIYRDVKLIVKICRIGCHMLAESSKPTEVVRKKWLDIARQFLIPSVSLMELNPGAVDAIWDVIKVYRYEERFALYGEWQTLMYKRHPELKLQLVLSEKETKGIMRRIGKGREKLFGRVLAKAAQSNPCVVFSVALTQVEAYSNIGEVVVECARYITLFGFDVLTYVMLTNLSNDKRSRLKNDGTSLGAWLQSLSAFCASMFKKYPYMDTTPLLTYVAMQLKQQQGFDLVIISELVSQMGGIERILDFNREQLESLSGGAILRQDASGLTNEKKKATFRDASRLLRHLENSGLVGPLTVLIAQQRAVSVYSMREQDSIVKLLATLFDESHAIFLQYTEFLIAYAEKDLKRYATSTHSLEEYVVKLGLEPVVAFHVCRPLIRAAIRHYDSDEETMKKQGAKMEGDNDVEMSDAPADGGKKSVEETAAAAEQQVWHPALTTIHKTVKEFLPVETWEYMTEQFYATFWQLELYDIHVPVARYQDRKFKLANRIREIDSDRSDMSAAAVRARKQRKQVLMDEDSQLSAEVTAQLTAYERTMNRLKKEKDHWFAQKIHQKVRKGIITNFLQHCIHPRVKFSAADAVFSARMIRQMHTIGTPNFSTLTMYDTIFSDELAPTIFICTPTEAENYGRFLAEILKDLTAWHRDAALYNREGRGRNLPGFQKRWQPKPIEEDFIDWEDFRKCLYKWHQAIQRAVKICLDSKDHMHISNCLMILEKIQDFFPTVTWMGKALKERIKGLMDKETRSDLQIRSMAYNGILTKLEPKLMTLDNFVQRNNQAASQTPAQTPANGEKKDTEQKTGTPLNPSAPSFQPGSAPTGPASTASKPRAPLAPQSAAAESALAPPRQDTRPPRRDPDRRPDNRAQVPPAGPELGTVQRQERAGNVPDNRSQVRESRGDRDPRQERERERAADRRIPRVRDIASGTSTPRSSQQEARDDASRPSSRTGTRSERGQHTTASGPSENRRPNDARHARPAEDEPLRRDGSDRSKREDTGVRTADARPRRDEQTRRHPAEALRDAAGEGRNSPRNANAQQRPDAPINRGGQRGGQNDGRLERMPASGPPARNRPELTSAPGAPPAADPPVHPSRAVALDLPAAGPNQAAAAPSGPQPGVVGGRRAPLPPQTFPANQNQNQRNPGPRGGNASPSQEGPIFPNRGGPRGNQGQSGAMPAPELVVHPSRRQSLGERSGFQGGMQQMQPSPTGGHAVHPDRLQGPSPNGPMQSPGGNPPFNAERRGGHMIGTGPGVQQQGRGGPMNGGGPMGPGGNQGLNQRPSREDLRHGRLNQPMHEAPAQGFPRGGGGPGGRMNQGMNMNSGPPPPPPGGPDEPGHGRGRGGHGGRGGGMGGRRDDMRRNDGPGAGAGAGPGGMSGGPGGPPGDGGRRGGRGGGDDRRDGPGPGPGPGPGHERGEKRDREGGNNDSRNLRGNGNGSSGPGPQAPSTDSQGSNGGGRDSKRRRTRN
ncbi:hypothetical protein G7K_2222-t1 [Saitoella complicata NRRL Y-17804]|uniref:THO complex subunit 2 n=1 Tax=Saitoella complicata (strain BCRC 22490 / CBS 7301 / JCM 7358 / NBRC 10748 / NRRL Y-17804) TaxID=698492 RepID=A0A0E9NDW2_SAICN|nr:hypothetical protein G7K_2222-t1 [Saitoella complicata NRRL Y-17804]